MAYFDHPDNNTGALCTRLATEASDVQGVMIELFDRLDLIAIDVFLAGNRYSNWNNATKFRKSRRWNDLGILLWLVVNIGYSGLCSIYDHFGISANIYDDWICE